MEQTKKTIRLEGESWEDMAARYADIVAMVKKLEKEKDAIRKIIEESTAGYDEAEIDGGYKVKYTQVTTKGKFDVALFAAAYPDIDLSGFFTPSTTSTRFDFNLPK